MSIDPGTYNESNYLFKKSLKLLADATQRSIEAVKFSFKLLEISTGSLNAFHGFYVNLLTEERVDHTSTTTEIHKSENLAKIDAPEDREARG